MSQEQPRRHEGRDKPESIKYGDVFNVSGDLASKAVAPQDAALMQSAETTAFGETQRGRPTEVVQSAARVNERIDIVSRGDVTDVARDQGVTITETDVPGGRVITESLGGQVVGQYVQVEARQKSQQGVITVGQALEATIQTAGDKPVDQSDSAAVRESEIRATGSNVVIQGGNAASAQSAAAFNFGMISDEDKIKLKDVLAVTISINVVWLLRRLGASAAFPAKAVNWQDAEAVVNAEQRNSPNFTTHPGGVASAMETAASLNESANV